MAEDVDVDVVSQIASTKVGGAHRLFLDELAPTHHPHGELRAHQESNGHDGEHPHCICNESAHWQPREFFHITTQPISQTPPYGITLI
jgi:hypothetical protein